MLGHKKTHNRFSLGFKKTHSHRTMGCKKTHKPHRGYRPSHHVKRVEKSVVTTGQLGV